MKTRAFWMLIVFALSVLALPITGASALPQAPSPNLPIEAQAGAGLTIHVNSWSQDRPDTNPGDGQCKTSQGFCTLRAAIQEANANPGVDLIFTNYGDSVTFCLNSPLPAITEAVTLLGSQVAGEYMRIDGAALPYGSDGLTLTGDHITVSHMSIVNFTGSGIRISGSENVVQDSLIGTNDQGQADLGNGQNGIVISGSYNQIENNVIVGSGQSGIRIEDGSQNKIWKGNVIGYWPGSIARLPNAVNGVRVIGGANTQIGGTMAEKNFIAGNTGSGIYIESTAGTVTVLANNIGVAANGQLLGNRHGVEVYGTNHTIGGSSTTGSLIAGNMNGVMLLGPAATNNRVQYNYMATITGTAHSGDGILLYNAGSGNQIEYNTIGRSGQHGVHIYQYFAGCVPNRVGNNWIGTNNSSNDLGNGLDGIYVAGNYCVYLQSNQVAYNQRYGIYLAFSGSDGSTLSMNQCFHNRQAGIRINSDGNTVSQNVVSLNSALGMWVMGSSNTLNANTALGSMIPSSAYQAIGIQIDGDGNTMRGHNVSPTEIAFHTGAGLVINGDSNSVFKYYIHSNGGPGVEIAGDDNVIGAAGSDRNTISVNDDGIQIQASASGSQVIGNYIGVETSGVGDAGNVTGMRIYGWGSQIESNRIAYSQGSNVVLSGSDAHDNTLQANNIGPTITGASHGILIENASSGNTVQDNQIFSSGSAGIYIASGAVNRLLSNTLTLNGGLGIDLAPAGVTLNDSGDGDGGANSLQNYPVLTTVVAESGETRIQGTLNSRPSTLYTIQFFLNTTCDGSGYGEAETYLGQTTLTTNSSGQAGFNVTLPVGGAAGKYVAATATHTNGDTSELSRCVLGRAPTSGVPLTVNTLGDAVDNNIGDGVCDSSGAAGQQCTLRAAVQETNALVGADTIILPAGTYPLTIAGVDITAAAGDLDITDELILVGAGADVTFIQSQVSDRVFEIRGTARASISGVTVRGGSAVDGGGLMVGSSAALTLDAVSVQENQATSGSGGGIYSSGALTLTHSAVITNTAGAENNGGGGIYLWSGTATLRNVTLSGNQTNGNGGGMLNMLASANLNNVTVAYNTADADNVGGDGGGLWTGTANTFVSNSIVAANLDLSHSSYSDGEADCSGTYTSQGYNLIGDRARAYDYPATSDGCTGFDNNDTVGGFWLMSNYLTYSAGLGALQLNGGATPNHMPVSAAAGMTVDWASPAAPGSGGGACEPFDQRGQPRPIDGGTDGIARCDRGAMEHVPAYLSIGDATVAEGGTAQFTVSLSEPAQITFTVQYSTTGITAQSGQDYVHTAGTLTFTPGQNNKTVQVSTLTDTRDEDTETFRARLYMPQYVFIADGEGIGSITDGNAVPALLINDRTASEGDTGSSTQMAFAVTLNSASGKTVTVHYTTADGSAAAGEDYVAQSGQLNFAPGVTTQYITLTVIGDDLREGGETFTVQLSGPANATLGDSSGLGTINDDDVPELAIGDSSLFEGDSGATTIYFTVRLFKPSTQQVTVRYATAPGTALAGSDYTHTSGTLTFAAGETLKTVGVSIVGDEIDEQNETFYVSLHTPTGGATIARATAAGSIREGSGFEVFLPLALRSVSP